MSRFISQRKQIFSKLDDSLEAEDKENLTFTKEDRELLNPKGISYSISFTPEDKKVRKTKARAIRKSLNNTVTLRRSSINETFTLPKQPIMPTITPVKIKPRFEKCSVLVLTRVIESLRITLSELERSLTNSTLRQVYIDNTKHKNCLIVTRFNVAAITLQQWWRRMLATRLERTLFKAHRVYLSEQRATIIKTKAAICLQKHWRALCAKKELEKLRNERKKRMQELYLMNHKFAWLDEICFSLGKENAPCKGNEMQLRLYRDRLKKPSLKIFVCDLLILRSGRKSIARKINAYLNFVTQQERKSAVVLQKHWRAKSARKLFSLMKQEEQTKQKAALILQKAWKGYIKHKKQLCIQEQQKLTQAAITLQSFWRMHLCLINYKKMIEERNQMQTAAFQIQRCWKAFLARKEFLNLMIKYHAAALIIQKNVRCYFCVKRYNLIKEKRVQSAIIIQRQWRVHHARVSFSKTIKKYRTAIITLQKHWRATKARRIVKLLFDAKAKEEQRKFIVREARKRLRSQQDAAIRTIQNNWKSYTHNKIIFKSIHALCVHHRAIITIQKNIRMWICRRKYIQIREIMKKQNDSALIIQKNWRMFIAKRNLNKMKKINAKQQAAALIIQKNWRMFIAKRSYCIIKAQLSQQKRSAVIIQKNWRRFICRKSFLKQKADLKLRHQSALCIQTYWRMYLCRSRYLQARKLAAQEHRSAVMIQKNWRMLVARRNYLSHMNQVRVHTQAAIVIQKCWRSYFTRLHYLEQLQEYRMQQTAAVIIQRAWRRRFRRGKRRKTRKTLSPCKRISLGKTSATKVNNSYLNNFVSLSLVRKLRLFSANMSLKYVKKTLEILESLNRKTSVCGSTCEIIAGEGIFLVLLSILKRCNRSEPHVRIVDVIFDILLNVATYDKSRPTLVKSNHFKNLLLHLILKYQKRQPIFLKCVTVLYILLKVKNFQERPAYLMKVKKVMSRFCFRSLRRYKRTPVYDFRPQWQLEKNSRHQFTSCNDAMNAFRFLLTDQ